MKPKFSKDESAVNKMRTFPKKPTPAEPMSNNKFQRMANSFKQQEQSGYTGGPQQRKIHFGGQPKMQYREGGKFYKPPGNSDGFVAKKGKFGDKTDRFNGKFGEKKAEKFNGKQGKFGEKNGKFAGKSDFNKKKVQKKKGDPVKGTSTEYAQMANSDDDEDLIDVEDMLEKEDEEEEEAVPMESEDDEGPEEVENPGEEPEEEEEDQEDEEEEEDDEEERLKFRAEISNMPLGKVREMKEKLGIKLFNKTYFGTSEVDKKRQEEKKKEGEKGGQHRPKEISSKRPVSSFRNIYGDHEKGTKKKRWDPRFDSRAGDFKEVCFENNYQFLDEIRSDEMKDLRSEFSNARAEGDEKKAARLKNTLQKMETREKTRAEKRRQAETRKELHDDNIERMLRGEAPIFRTKAQVRRIDAEKKFDELKKDNKLDKYMQKKAKKESAKQKKARPFEGYGYGN
uniref:rRNA biogenesis protein RRP36 n=1 Tax=Caenorhabditis tropicalis TaxID=1561998 RepID=A0A1I7T9X5_9PELO